MTNRTGNNSGNDTDNATGNNTGDDFVPKPYDFVPIAPLGRGDRRHPHGHDRYHRNTLLGTIRGTLIAHTPLHVWSGEIEATGNAAHPLVKSHFTVGGRPAIPGSSLKGAIRSMVEAMTNSCVRATRARRHELPPGAEGCSKKEQLCPACRIFGAMDFQGNVRFGDAVLAAESSCTIDTIASLYAPRRREAVYYNGKQVKGRKFYRHGRPAYGDLPIEVCPVGAKLAFQLHFENLQPAEVGLLLISLGQGDGNLAPRMWPKLGGAKPVCRGTLEVVLGTVTVSDAASADTQALYTDYDEPATTTVADHRPYLRAAQQLIVPQQLAQLAAILQPDDERLCPTDSY